MLGESADQALAEMSGAQDDQTSFARASRKLLAALDLAEAEVDAEPDDNSDDGDDGGEQSGQQDDSQDGEGQSESEQDSMLGAQPEEMEGEARSRRRRPRLPRVTIAPVGRSRDGIARTRITKPSTALTRGRSTKKSRPRNSATLTN